MDANRATAQEEAPFRAVLVPGRSLSATGFVAVMAAVSVVSGAAGLLFCLLGAWPVAGFLGLDVALIYLAFRLNYRSGRLRETVEVAAADVTVTRIYPSGREEVWRFLTAWVQVDLDEARDGRTELRLRHHDRRLVLARFLNDDERRDLATALAAAIRSARRPTFA